MINTFLLGDSDETVSARASRARNAGQTWAKWFCSFLTWSQKIVTFGKVTRDHCDYALDKSIEPNTREIWSWSKMKIHDEPENEVDVVDKNN